MDDNKLRFGVGVLVIASIAIGIILTFLFGAFPAVLAREYTLLVEFPSAAGVSTNTPVLRDGVKIGRVTDIRLLDTEGVLLEMAMSDEHHLSHEYIPRIGVGSVITGDATVEFIRATRAQLEKALPGNLDEEFLKSKFSDQDWIDYGIKAEDPFNMLNGIETQVSDTLAEISNAATKFRTTVGNTDRQIDNVSQGATKTIQELQREGVEALNELQLAIQDVRKIVGSQEVQANVKDAAAALPDVVNEAYQTLGAAKKTFKSFEDVGKEFQGVGEVAQEVGNNVKQFTAKANTTVDKANKTLDTVTKTVEGAGDTITTIKGTFQSADRTIKNVEKFSVPLARRSEEIVQQVVTSLKNVDRALAEIETLGATINNDQGSIQRLLKDEEMYWNLRRTLENVEQASSRLRPILDDVRIFTDKVARDPRQLGVRGAITRRPNGMGLK